MTSWRGDDRSSLDDRLHLSYNQPRWRLSWQISKQVAAELTNCAWADITAKLTHCNRSQQALSSWWNTPRLTGCSRANDEKSCSSSNMSSWCDNLIGTSRVQLSWLNFGLWYMIWIGEIEFGGPRLRTQHGWTCVEEVLQNKSEASIKRLSVYMFHMSLMFLSMWVAELCKWDLLLNSNRWPQIKSFKI